ncbi:SDR family oxidoreductase [Sneathiella limimaris]|uniref:SDR family oxidoreductase n=1 Tax=Sneathiella limimaris TaxID=1964213 RepID=UPI00146A64F6|nr:SDR family oxidoreductase [Sneathiella limimaris]
MVDGLLCFGFGFTAQELARQNPTWQVWGTSRDPEKISQTSKQVHPLKFDGRSQPDGLEHIQDQISHILLSIPPGEDGDPVLQVLYDQIGKFSNLKWIGYLSTTGVYGDLAGGTATEETPLNPSGKRGQRRVDAEQAWQQLAAEKNLPLHIFRLPGIYGPGRNQLVSLQKGKAHRIVKKGHMFSRIHVTDIAKILTASMLKPNPGRIYNVSDDLPAPPQDVVTYAAELLGIDPPPLQDFETADMTPMARSFYSDNKRICNRRIKEELGVSLTYPDYKKGLKALSEGA